MIKKWKEADYCHHFFCVLLLNLFSQKCFIIRLHNRLKCSYIDLRMHLYFLFSRTKTGFPYIRKVLESVQKRTMKMMKGLDRKPHKERLWSVGLFCLERDWAETSSQSPASSWAEVEGKALISSFWQSVIGPEGMASSCLRKV